MALGRSRITRAPRWLVILAIWTVPAIVAWSQILLTPLFEPGADIPVLNVLVLQLALWWFWAPLTPVIASLRQRWPLDVPPRAPGIAIHLTVSLVLAAVLAALNAALVIALFPESPWSGFGEFTLRFIQTRGHFSVLIYWATFGALSAVAYARQLADRTQTAAELQQRLLRAELDALEKQLQPHFLFNTLHAIGVLVREDPDKAGRMVTQLGELLRSTLDAGTAQEVTLAAELRVLDLYLDIQRTRFSDRLAVDVDIPDPLRSAAVPSLVLQPLVENAVRHAVEPRPGPAHISIAAARAGDMLELTVSDDGPGLSSNAKDGIGLANTRARLAAMYGDAQALSVANGTEGGVRSTVRIPFRVLI
jgi:two-component system, LytTR family, sensor kinase